MILIRDLNPKDMVCLKSEIALASSDGTSVNCALSPKKLAKRDSSNPVSTCGTVTNTDEAPVSKMSGLPGLIRAAVNPPGCPLPNSRILAMVSSLLIFLLILLGGCC